MPTSSTYIITGNSTGNINSTLAANGYDKNLNVAFDNNYAQVLTINDDRSIYFEPLDNNLNPKYNSEFTSSLYTGSLAFPSSNTIFKLPIPGELVKIFNGPEGQSASNNPAQPPPKVYYEPAPLLAWNDVNNNKVLANKLNEKSNRDRSNLNTNIVSYKNTFNGFT